VSAAPLLDVSELRVSYGGVVALDDVDLRVEAGAVVGLIGPNGAGKTTFIDCLTGFIPASSGQVNFDGERFTDLAPHERARRGLVRTFQSLELFDDLSVRENLLVGAGVPTWRSTLADAFRLQRHRLDAADEVLDLLDLTAVADDPPATLSNGRRHLVALGRALAAKPRLVLLDEPAAGLDPAETDELQECIASIPRLGCTVLLVDHDMSLVFGVCDAVHVLDFGRIIAAGSPAAVRADPTVVAAYQGSGSSAT
jgi:branched-chain amino acid transport system ATP-binding protein